MPNPFLDQKLFMQKCEQTVDIYNPEQTELYVKLMVEEFKEAIEAESLENYLKELADLIVVTIGTMYSIGADAQMVWDLVVQSNMSKIPFTKREDGKVEKGKHYKPADLKPVVDRIKGLAEQDKAMTEEELTNLNLDVTQIPVVDLDSPSIEV